MTPPAPPQEQAPRLDAARADHLAAVYGIRSSPLPPAELLDGAQYADAQSGDSLFNTAVSQITAPHWNSAVDLLRGPGGHFALIQLRDRLAGHLAELVYNFEQSRLDADLVQTVCDVLAKEAERYGPKSEIGSSLATRTPLTVEDAWWWEPKRLSGQEWHSEVPGAPPAFFTLRSSDIDALIAASSWEHKDLYVMFERTCTWAEAIVRVSGIQEHSSRSDLDNDKLHDFVEFRLRVVEQVLREHELLGHVGEFGMGAPRRVVLTAQQTTFLNAALIAIDVVEADAADPSNKRRRSWSNVSGSMEHLTSWSVSTLERIAEDSFTLFGGPAFVKQEARGSGPLPRSEEIDRYDLFCRVMRAYDRARRAPEGMGSA